MKKISLYIYAIIISFSGLTYVDAYSFSSDFRFTKDLQLGDTDQHVLFLQELLNTDNRTLVATEGFGSSGNETNYFGQKTKEAVIKFQELYASDILVPNNLLSGTGFVGVSTRAKLNTILESITTRKNSAYYEYTSDADSNDTRSNKKKRSSDNNDDDDNIIINTNKSVFSETRNGNTNPNRPVIEKVSPKAVNSPNKEITIEGNFGTTTVLIYGNLGEITNILPKDGKTISLRLSDFSSYEEGKLFYSGQKIAIYMTVANQYGYSDDFAVVTYTFPGSISQAYLDAVSQSSTGNESTSSNNSNNNNSSDNSSDSGGVVSSIGKLNKQMFAMSPHGSIIKLVGGEEMFNKAYALTPGGLLFGTGESESNGSVVAGGAAAGGLLGGLFGGGGGMMGGGGGGMSTHFGGRITNVTYCTCSGAIMLDIQDIATNNSLSVLFQYGISTLHANYNIYTSGINVIGGYTPGGGQCQIYVGESCESQGSPRGTIDTIRGIGTAASSGGGGQ